MSGWRVTENARRPVSSHDATYNSQFFQPSGNGMDPGNVIDFPNRKIGDEIPRRSEPPKDPKGNRWTIAILSVAGAAAVAMAYLAVNAHNIKAPPPPPVAGSLSTVRGEHRCEKLPDASEVCLNTGTSIRYAFTDHARCLEIISGEATFNVHRDP